MRSDGDTWDIVSSVGRTALGVATFRAVETERRDPLIHDEFARWFVEAAGEPRFAEILTDPSVIDEQDFFLRMMGPRTRYFDDYFTDAAAHGVRQAVILAAGLDARAYRLDWLAGATVFEIDRDTVLEFKNKVLGDHAAEPRADRRTVAADLRENWPATLTAAGFDAATPTAWLAEGLLPYLPGVAQDSLFERIDELSAGGSRLGAHSGPAGPGDLQRFRTFIEARMQAGPWGSDAPFDLWYDDARADPIDWLAERGWTVRGITVPELFASYDRPMPDMPDLPPELAALRNRASFWTAEKQHG
ncbi:class I SAM-dependent methyltransferase [Nocardia sp. NEAU-G5]|uniref:S-adenosyl-L-methionine-dependent methyltransferase n=1 Tax=Nocardia albiluteola TaxID=2842303 RepID=A0ABS6BB11_9NOCA|nr:class I SAM-dependent methyltransferase [Nocardia albiluteola]MBU3067464.1 class I SAM-dependent methyltransferase [Nocardia albiluteola]